MISSFVKFLSSFTAMIHSFNFWITRNALLEALSLNRFSASCCVIVLPPPCEPNVKIARMVDLKSIPL